MTVPALRCLRALCAAALLSTACLPSGLEQDDHPPQVGKVHVRYLGVGGLFIERNHDVIMTAPLYSNPTKTSALNDPIPPNQGVIDAFLKAHQIEKRLPDVRAILIGHAHYDHLMDVPYVLTKAKNAVAVGSVSAGRVLAGSAVEARQIVVLNEAGKNYVNFTACRGTTPPQTVVGNPSCVVPSPGTGGWYPVPGTGDRVRVYAVCSRHPPQVGVDDLTIHFFPGCADCTRTHPPLFANDYPEGEVFAYVIDFYEGSDVAFRMFYEDAPIPPELTGVLAMNTLKPSRRTDLAILCSTNWEQVPGTERVVSREILDAQEVILGHWEDFFDPSPPGQRKLQALPISPPDVFRTLVAAQLSGTSPKARVHILAPGVLRNFPR